MTDFAVRIRSLNANYRGEQRRLIRPPRLSEMTQIRFLTAASAISAFS